MDICAPPSIAWSRPPPGRERLSAAFFLGAATRRRRRSSTCRRSCGRGERAGERSGQSAAPARRARIISKAGCARIPTWRSAIMAKSNSARPRLGASARNPALRAATSPTAHRQAPKSRRHHSRPIGRRMAEYRPCLGAGGPSDERIAWRRKAFDLEAGQAANAGRPQPAARQRHHHQFQLWPLSRRRRQFGFRPDLSQCRMRHRRQRLDRTKAPSRPAGIEARHPQAKIIRRPANDGQTPAALDGLAASSGPYVIFLDADDLAASACRRNSYFRASLAANPCRLHLGRPASGGERRPGRAGLENAFNRVISAGRGVKANSVRPYRHAVGGAPDHGVAARKFRPHDPRSHQIRRADDDRMGLVADGGQLLSPRCAGSLRRQSRAAGAAHRNRPLFLPRRQRRQRQRPDRRRAGHLPPAWRQYFLEAPATRECARLSAGLLGRQQCAGEGGAGRSYDRARRPIFWSAAGPISITRGCCAGSIAPDPEPGPLRRAGPSARASPRGSSNAYFLAPLLGTRRALGLMFVSGVPVARILAARAPRKAV